MFQNRKSVSGRMILIGAALLWLAAGRNTPADEARQHPWHVSKAELRFKLTLQHKPSLPEAGYIVQLPDGGLLPQPAPGTTVVDASGNRLAHGCLWHDPAHGLALVFETPPGSGYVYVYVEQAPKLQAWDAASGIKPSLVQYFDYGGSGMSAARRPARNFPPGPGIHFSRAKQPLLGSEPFARPGAFADYTLGYVKTSDPGKTWMALLGETEIEIELDGKKLRKAKRGLMRKGGIGGWVSLDNQPHRLEVFHYYNPASNKRGYDKGWFCVGWKGPHTPPSKLGAQNNAQSPEWFGYQIEEGECVQSGTADIVRIEHRDNLPVAAFEIIQQEYFFFQNTPIVLCKLKTYPQDRAEGLEFIWRFNSAGRLSDDEEPLWLYEGGRVQRAGLTISLAGRDISTCAYDFPAYSTVQSNIENKRTCDKYRSAFFNMFRAYPENQDPTENWSADMWDLFYQLLQPGSGNAMIAHIFSKRWDRIKPRLDDNHRRIMEDNFFELVCRIDPRKAEQWLDKIDGRTRIGADRIRNRFKRVALLMYYLNDLKEAEKLAGSLLTGSGSAPLRARVRLGDIALLKGDYARAIEIYGEAGDRFKRTRLSIEASEANNMALSGLDDTDEWKVTAARETSFSETARSLLAQEEYLKVRKILSWWELEAPLSKISSDYMIVEARYYMALLDYVRAAKELEAYCKASGMTSYLPEAMRLAITCKMELKQPRHEIDAFVDRLKKRFPDHPASIEMERLLERY